jgi:hypothetical protein
MNDLDFVTLVRSAVLFFILSIKVFAFVMLSNKGVSLARDRCVKAAAVSKVRFVGVAREDYAGRVGVRSP